METYTQSPGLVIIRDRYVPLPLIFSGTPRSFSMSPFLRHRSSPISKSASHYMVSPPLLITLCSSYSPPLQKYPEHWQYADSGLELLFFTPKPASVQKPIMMLLFSVLSIFIVYFFRLVCGISASVMKLQQPFSPSLRILAELALMFVRVQYGICRFQKWCAIAGLQITLPEPPYYLFYSGFAPWNYLCSCSISFQLFYLSPASCRRCLDCCSSISFLILSLSYLNICLLVCACSCCSLAVFQNCSRIYLCIFSLIYSNFFLFFSRQAFCPLRVRLRRSDSLFILASFSINYLYILCRVLWYSLLILSNLRNAKSKGVISSFFRAIFIKVCFFSPAFSQKQMKFNTPVSSKTISLKWSTRQWQVSCISLGRHLNYTLSVMSIQALSLQYLSNVSVSQTQTEMDPACPEEYLSRMRQFLQVPQWARWTGSYSFIIINKYQHKTISNRLFHHYQPIRTMQKSIESQIPKMMQQMRKDHSDMYRLHVSHILNPQNSFLGLVPKTMPYQCHRSNEYFSQQ